MLADCIASVWHIRRARYWGASGSGLRLDPVYSCVYKFNRLSMSSQHALAYVLLAAKCPEAVSTCKETQVEGMTWLDYTYIDFLDIPASLGGSTKAAYLDRS